MFSEEDTPLPDAFDKPHALCDEDDVFDDSPHYGYESR